MEYRIIRTGEEPDSFEHALFGGGRQKGVQNKNHKYLARAWWRNKWRYAYTEAEVRALQMLGKGKNGGLADQKKLNDAKRDAKEAKKQMEKTDKAMAKSVNNAIDKAKGTANVATGQAKKVANQVSNAVQKTAYDTKKNATKTANKVINDVMDKAKGTANVISGRAKQTADNASNAIQKTAYKVQRSAKEALDDVKSGTAGKQLGIKAQTAANNLKEDAPKAASKAVSSIKSATEKGKAKASELLSSASNKGKQALSSAKDAATKGKAKAESMLESTSAAVKQKIKDEKDYRSRHTHSVVNPIDTAKENIELAKNAAKSAVKTVADIPKNVRDAVNEKRNYHNKVDAQYKSASDEYEERRGIHTSNYDKYWDSESTEAQKKVADKALNDNWKPMLDSARKKSAADQKREDKAYADSEELDRKLTKAENAVKDTKAKIKNAASKVYDKVTDDIEKVRESDAMAYANKAAEKVKDKVSDTAEKVTDKVTDATANARHIADANKAKAKYGTDSLQYKEAKAHVDYDKTVDELAKARKKYGVDSTQYKQAAAAESKARETWQDAREQNLYKNNKEYRTYSDRASYLGSYLDNWDAKGGPQTTEGKANYQKMLRELNALENKLDNLRR